jgi:urease accessory protein
MRALVCHGAKKIKDAEPKLRVPFEADHKGASALATETSDFCRWHVEPAVYRKENGGRRVWLPKRAIAPADEHGCCAARALDSSARNIESRTPVTDNAMPAAQLTERPDTPPAMQRVRGEGRLVTQVIDGRTRISTLYQDGAAKIRLPHTHDRSLEAVLMNTAGGLTGGDRIAWSATAVPGSHLIVTTPASERVYRSLGTDAVVEIRLSVAAGARLDWLPQETILFEGARLNRRLEIDLAENASLLAVEAVLLGRRAMGEAAYDARLVDNWRIRRAGRLLHAEATRLSADRRERDSLSLLAGAAAFATLLYIGNDAARRHQAIRELDPPPEIGSSLVGEKLVVRALAPSGLALRRAIVPIIDLLSGSGRVPRLWHI